MHAHASDDAHFTTSTNHKQQQQHQQPAGKPAQGHVSGTSGSGTYASSPSSSFSSPFLGMVFGASSSPGLGFRF